MRNARLVGHMWRPQSLGGVTDEPMMRSALDSVTKRRGIGGRGGRIAAIVEHDDLERHAADFLRHELERVAFGNAERGRGTGRGDGDADSDVGGLGKSRCAASASEAATAAIRQACFRSWVSSSRVSFLCPQLNQSSAGLSAPFLGQCARTGARAGALDAYAAGLTRRHAQRGVEPDHLAVEIRIVDHVQCETRPRRHGRAGAETGSRCGETVPRLLRQARPKAAS